MDLYFLTEADVVLIHDEILSREPGAPGLDTSKPLSSILNRIHSHCHYNGMNEIYEIAALYAFAIAKGHGFIDANKRTAFISMFVFLYSNGYSLIANDYTSEIEDLMVSIAEDKININAFQKWINKNTIKIS
jgi:death-on-curing protein